MALSGVGSVKMSTKYAAGSVAGAAILNRKTSHMPVWDVGGTKHQMSSLIATAAANDSGYIEVPAWESARLQTGGLVVDVSNLPEVFPELHVQAGNAFGSISGKALTYLFVANNSSVIGSIDGMPLEFLRVTDTENITGSIDNKPLYHLFIAGNSQLYGSIDGMSLDHLYIANNMNINGSISGKALTFLYIANNMNIDGSIDGMPLEFLFVTDSLNISLSAVPVFADPMERILFRDAGITAAMVDLLLEGASLVNTWSGSKLVQLVGSTPPPSAAGQAFIPAITAAGATVEHN